MRRQTYFRDHFPLNQRKYKERQWLGYNKKIYSASFNVVLGVNFSKFQNTLIVFC